MAALSFLFTLNVVCETHRSPPPPSPPSPTTTINPISIILEALLQQLAPLSPSKPQQFRKTVALFCHSDAKFFCIFTVTQMDGPYDPLVRGKKIYTFCQDYCTENCIKMKAKNKGEHKLSKIQIKIWIYLLSFCFSSVQCYDLSNCSIIPLIFSSFQYVLVIFFQVNFCFTLF